LPILLGISQVLQTRFMPRGAPSAQAGSGGAPDQLEQQRKMMMIMSVVFVFILYNAPSGLNLYIMVNNVLSVFEQWRIRKHLAELEARGMDAAQEPGWLSRVLARTERTRKGPKAEPREKSWLQRKWDGLQREVEEAKKIRSARDKGKR
jgi:membrane protein insertase Oxa1/YidC/SpoIIIJ